MDSISPEVFARTLDYEMRRLGLSAEDISAEIDVSLPSVARWRDGRTCPVPEVRVLVLALLARISAARTVESLGGLASDWDTYGADAIDEEAIARAAALVGILLVPPQPVPLTDGSVGLEWHREGWDVELEIHADGSVTGSVERAEADARASDDGGTG